MSLPSQTARTSSSGRSFVYKRRRSRRKSPLAAVVIAGVALVLIVAAYFIFDPFAAKADQPVDSTSGVTDPLVSSRTAGPGGEPGRDPGAVVFDQGSAGGDRPTGGDRFTKRADDRRRSATAEMPSEDVTIPSLVPPPLEEDRGMLDEALASNDDRDAPSRRLENRPVTTPEPARPAAGTPRDGDSISAHLRAADDLIERNDPLAARQALWDAMRMPGLDDVQFSVLRARLTALNEDLLFGPVRRAGDPLSKAYTVRAGDALSRIARRESLGTHWRLIQRVNGLSAPEKIRVGQTLKIVPGTFHAVVDKSEFRLDLYHGEPERPEDWVFIRSFDVGLGEGDSTPIGQFIVRADGKLENPGWVNPRNPAEKFGRDDPDNPIGDFWVGLDGLGDAAAYAGYGLHGTIEPDSIGRERSMGCVRMRAGDIALVYELMSEGRSLVRIKR
mgnify:CR=1 FL=1